MGLPQSISRSKVSSMLSAGVTDHIEQCHATADGAVEKSKRYIYRMTDALERLYDILKQIIKWTGCLRSTFV